MENSEKKKVSMNFGGWGWVMIIYSLLMYFTMSGWAADGLNIFIPAFGKEHGWDPADLLMLVTVAGLIGIIGSFVFGQMIMKKGPRAVLLLCLACGGLATIWFGRIASLWEFGASFTIIVFFSNGYGFVAPGTLITNWFPTKKGIALGWATMGMPLATAVFVPLIAFLFGRIGIPGATMLGGLVQIALAVVAFFLIKDNPEQIGLCPDNEPISKEQIEANLREIESYVSPFTIKRLLKDKDMWLISLGFGCAWMVTVGIVTQLVPRLMSIGYDQKTSIGLLAAAAVCAVPGSIFWGWLDQKFGTRRAGICYTAVYILTLFLLIFQTSNIVITFLTVAAVGAGLGGIKNLITSMIGTVYGRLDFTAANRIILPISIIVRTLAFALTGVGLKLMGGYAGAYALFIIVDIIGLVLIFLITPILKEKMA